MISATDRALCHEIEQLLYREARILDLQQYEAWLELLSDKVRYWAPVRSNLDEERFDRPRLLALFDDHKADLAIRVKRIRTGHAHAEQPPSRVRRLISNVLLLEAGETSIKVASTFLVTVSRWDSKAKVFSGAREDRWTHRAAETAERSTQGWLLEERRILFDLSTTENMSFLV